MNKDLLIAMGVKEQKLKNNYITVSKNKNNTSLKSINNDFILDISYDKKKDENKNDKEENDKEKNDNDNKINEENKNYISVDYVEDITIKIFILLYFNEKINQKKIKKNIKDVYNFKNYYLINKEWLNEYKKFFNYDMIISQLINGLDLKNNINNYTYKELKYDLDDIVKNKIGKIDLNNNEIDNKIRNGNNLIPKMKKIEIKENKEEEIIDYMQETNEPEINYNLIEIPYGFEIINEDIFELIIQEKFFFNLNNIIDRIKFKLLLGNNQIVIKSKNIEQNREMPKYLDRYLFYININEINDFDEIEKNDCWIIYYILEFEKEDYFFNDLETIVKNGILNYISKKNLQLNEDKNNYEQDIMDDYRKKFIGKFINIRVKEIEGKNNNKDKDKINLEINKVENINIIIKNNMNNLDNNQKQLNDNENNNNIIIENKNTINIDDNNSSILKKDKDFIESNIFIEKDLINKIEKYIKSLFEIPIDLENWNIKGISLDDILNNSVIKGIEIILMNENSFIKFKKYINYDLIVNYKYIINNEDKNKYIQNNINEFNKIYKVVKDKKKIRIPKDIPLNEQCLKNIENNNKFILLNSNKLHTKPDEIYYFKSENEFYITFKKNKKIFQVIKENYEYCKLVEYTIQKEIRTEELLLNIYQQIINNKKEENFKEYKYLEYDDFKQFYLINEIWLNNKINNKDNNKNENLGIIEFKIKIKYEVPINFGFIEKNEINDSRIKSLKIKNGDLNIKTLFFISGNNYISPYKLYFGIIWDKTKIYFYLFDKGKYSLEFKIVYDNEEIMKEEIDKNIIPKGIEEYLYENGVNFSIIGKKQNLFNIDLKKVGSFYNKNKNNDMILKQPHTKNLEAFQNSYYYSAVMQCLTNIGFLKDIFLNREYVYKENMINNYKKITTKFYKIMQYMWYWKSNINEQKEEYIEFLNEIQSLSGISNIHDKIDSLIEFLLLSMHFEQAKSKIKENINYNLNTMKPEFFTIKDSFIMNLIYSKFKLTCDKCKSKKFLYAYMFYLNIKELIKNQNLQHSVQSLFSFKQEFFCDECQIMAYSDKEFNILPKILIIVIQDIENSNINLELNEKIYLKNQKKEIVEFELISIIKEDKNKIKNNKKEKEGKKSVITYFKSPINNKWYKYEEKQNKIQEEYFEIIKFDNYIPSLLIYKKI